MYILSGSALHTSSLFTQPGWLGMSFVNILRGVLLLLIAPIVTFLASSLAILFAAFHLDQVRLQAIPRFWARIFCVLGGVDVEVHGMEHLESGKVYIFAANHQSQFDIFALQGYLRHDFRWLAKKELFNIPFFGSGMRRAGHIPVDRAHGRKAIKSLDAAAKEIAAGTSVVIFPEGTRSADGSLQPFKAGGMLLAIKAGVSIVPMAITGSHKVLPKGRMVARPGKIIITMGMPIDAGEFTLKQKHELAERLHAEIDRLITAETASRYVGAN